MVRVFAGRRGDRGQAREEGVKMHALKKVMHKVVPVKADASYVVEKDATILDRAGKLKMTKDALKPTQAQVKEAEKNWKGVFTTMETTFASMVSSYPDDDSVKQMAKTVAKESSDAQRNASNAQLNSQSYNKAASNLDAYLAEITKLDAEYKKLEDLRVDYEMYAGKVHGLEGKAEKKGGPDEKSGDKINRNHEKLDSAKKAYQEKIEFVAARQEELLGQQEDAFRIAYSAIFYAHALFLDTMDKSFVETFDHAFKKETDTLAFRFSDIHKTSFTRGDPINVGRKEGLNGHLGLRHIDQAPRTHELAFCPG
ncbi:hypothetical protein FVE85_2847 [Porphyridium purpureum]|uniref:BAR domain-containing protein n=1 Tax=Porphyridium purpureum TaxID=35688 RepID=A0A5J4YTC9_PORPP|nr:hypothetical protein FVE85_2847 [Porphyridium purpureum]|eukprot:POR2594..scf227_4